MEDTQKRVEKIHSWLRDVTGLEEQGEGTVGWLIARAAENPMYLARAGRNVWRAIHETLPDGSVPVPLRNLPAPLNRLYDDQPDRMRMYPVWKDFFGIEGTIARCGNFFEQADGGHEEERQALWLRGPAGSGKTTFVRTLCERLEDFTFWTIDGCAYHEHPLHMVPKRERAVLFEAFYPFEGSPCPDCWRRLQNEISHKNCWWEIPVQELQYSEGAACGIAFVDHRVADQRSDSIPEEWVQILQREANGGLLIVQCTKEAQPAAFMELISEVAQSRYMNIKGSAARVCLDIAVVFLANSTVREYKSGDDAFRSRMQECILPLVVSPRAEKCVVEKLNRHLTHTYHFMRHVEDALNLIVCVSRLRDQASPDASALLQRIRLYDGEAVSVAGSAPPRRLTRKQAITEYKSKSSDVLDGTTFGMSIRSALKMRSIAGELCENGCVTIQDALLAAARQLEAEGFTGDVDTFPRKFLADSATEVDVNGNKIKISELEALCYQKAVQRDLVRAWVGPARFDQGLEDLKDKYLDHADAYVNKTKVKDRDTREELQPDDGFLKEVEKYARVESAEKHEAFRREVNQWFFERKRREEAAVLSDIPMFQEALWKHDATAPFKEIRVAFELEPAEKRDPAKEKKKIEVMEKNLADMGYGRLCCIPKLLGNYKTTGYIRKMNLKP